MIKYLKIENEEDYKAFEEAVYHNFVEKTKDKWIIQNYIKTSTNRIKPFYDYKDLLCFIVKEDNHIIAGNAVYIGNEITQSEKIGFKIPEWIKNTQYCDGLIFFKNESKYHPGYIMESFDKFYTKELSDRGYELLLITCFENLLKIYKYASFQIITEKYNNDEKKNEYFLYKKII